MDKRTIYIILVMAGLVLFQKGSLSAQSAADTVLNEYATSALFSDSSGVDSVKTDSLPTASSSAPKMEGPIPYSADIVSVSRKGNKIYLEGNAKVAYQTMTLEAAKIVIDQNNHQLFAEGIVDTVDSLGNPVYSGVPVFTERGEEPMRGNTLQYDFETKRGKIGYGKTRMPPGYYKGERIYKISEKTLLIEDGYFTSCEYIDEPHFYFRSPKMRVQVKEKVVARPVYLYIADVPVAVIPFGIFPNKKGRHSGILIPSYGESSYGGRFLKNMGYYWAPNDYLDGTFTTDYYDKMGFTYQAQLNYVIRYILNGNVSGFYFPRDPNRPSRRNRWAVQFAHNHNIDPTMRLAASGKFQSDGELAQDYASDYNRRVDQILTSNMTLSKKWSGTRNSMQLSLSRTENLQTGNISYTTPNIRFTRSQASLYETFTGEAVRGKKEWYHGINFSYNSSLLNKGSKTKVNENEFETSESRGVEHNIGLNAPQKILKYFNIAPSLNYKEIWVDELTSARFDPETNKITKEQIKDFGVRRTFNGAVGLNTTLFGMFEPNIGSLKFIRHKMDPRISFQIAPDFSSPFYGYYNTFTDTTGKEIKVDKFEKNPYGRTPTSKSQSMQISLNNLFQAKLIDGEEERKLDLFTVNFNTGYNFLADSLKWGNISSSFRASPVTGVNFTVSSSHSLYKRNSEGKGAINEYTLPRLLNLNANVGFALDQNTFKPTETEEKLEKDKETTTEQEKNEGIISNEFLTREERSDEFAAKSISIPWRINLNMNYSMNRADINNISERFNVKATANVTLTKNWRINWTATIDAVKKELVYQSFSIYRDLHCWEMSFNWQPTVNYYSFRINVKADILQDLKVTKQPSGSGRSVGY